MKKGKAVDLNLEGGTVFGGSIQAAKKRGYLESIMIWMRKYAFEMEISSDDCVYEI